MRIRIGLLFLFMLIFASNVDAQSYNRSIDMKPSKKAEREAKKREKLTREEKYVIKLEDNKTKSDKRKKKKDERLHKKAVRKHNKVINGQGKNAVTGKKVHKQMKQSRKEANRRNASKNPLPWYKRIFR
ncbi:MAG: hypothetical protein GX879_07150 [Bacteroidales bacterium]|nr:hypothetical protein [Bacteroidales bacterium]